MRQIPRWFALSLLWIGVASCAQPAAPIAAALGTAFALRVGQTAQIADGPRVELTAMHASGKCPDHHVECVWVSPPEAVVEVADAGVSEELHFILAGLAIPPPQRVRAWNIRVVKVQPPDFSDDDVGHARTELTLLVARDIR